MIYSYMGRRGEGSLRLRVQLELSRPPGSSLIAYSLQVPMGIWTRPFSSSSRGTTDTQQWFRNAQERRS